jgi:hypothetical protein
MNPDRWYAGQWETPAALAKEMFVWVAVGTLLEILLVVDGVISGNLSFKALVIASLPYLILLASSAASIVAAYRHPHRFPLKVALRGPLGVFVLFVLPLYIRRRRRISPRQVDSFGNFVAGITKNESENRAAEESITASRHAIIAWYYLVLGLGVTTVCVVAGIGSIGELGYDASIFRSRIQWILALIVGVLWIGFIGFAGVGLSISGIVLLCSRNRMGWRRLPIWVFGQPLIGWILIRDYMRQRRRQEQTSVRPPEDA